ncbi:hypothetical protein FACS1894176_11740 [Bacteroidia bacterium]|nr:hypothetical protein FACS1894176_11740 [Bacteroidia bacterium]
MDVGLKKKYNVAKTVNIAMNPIENVSAWLYRVARNMIVGIVCGYCWVKFT